MLYLAGSFACILNFLFQIVFSSNQDLQSLTVVILKKFLVQYQLDTTGRKSELVERLGAHIESLKAAKEADAPAEEADAEETTTEQTVSSPSSHFSRIYPDTYVRCSLHTNELCTQDSAAAPTASTAPDKPAEPVRWTTCACKFYITRRWVSTVTLVISLY